MHVEPGRPRTSGRTLYYAINALLAPVTASGYALWLATMYSQRQQRVSLTAQGPLSARWFMHELGTRPDPAAHELLPILPGVSPRALHLVSAAMRLGHRASGYVPKAFRYPYEGDVARQHEAAARQMYFDHAVERHTDTDSQLVILGAGFDTRALSLPSHARPRTFEVDMPATQTLKRELLARAGIDTAGVTFVPADLLKDDWMRELVAAGFERDRRTLFVCEGLTMYLDRDAVETILRTVAATAKGNAIAFDYFTTEPLASHELYWRYARATTSAAHEPITWGIDSTPPVRERVAELLHACGLSLDEQHTFGDEVDGKRAWGGFAIAVVPALTP